jgi:hypothetical protein
MPLAVQVVKERSDTMLMLLLLMIRLMLLLLIMMMETNYIACVGSEGAQ